MFKNFESHRVNRDDLYKMKNRTGQPVNKTHEKP